MCCGIHNYAPPHRQADTVNQAIHEGHPGQSIWHAGGASRRCQMTVPGVYCAKAAFYSVFHPAILLPAGSNRIGHGVFCLCGAGFIRPYLRVIFKGARSHVSYQSVAMIPLRNLVHHAPCFDSCRVHSFVPRKKLMGNMCMLSCSGDNNPDTGVNLPFA